MRFAAARVVFFALLLSSFSAVASPVARADGGGAIITTDKENYFAEETVMIAGSGFLVNAVVTITVTRPDGKTATWDVSSDEAGSFTTTYQLDGIEGNYTVKATDGTNTATTSFFDAPQIQFRQCSTDVNNDNAVDSPMCDWVVTSLNETNTVITEGNNAPPYPPGIPGHVTYRMIFEGLVTGTYEFTLNYSFTRAGRVAFDFLTASFGVTDANLCDDLPSGFLTATCLSLIGAGADTITFPPDLEGVTPGLGGGVIADRQRAHDAALSGLNPRAMKMYGANITGITNLARTGPDAGDSNDTVKITFVKSTGSTSAAIATWSGHLGIGANAPVGYGPGMGASSILGDTIHMVVADVSRTTDPVDTTLENAVRQGTDRRLASGTTIIQRIGIIEDSVPNDSRDFQFSGSNGIGAFYLDDDSDPTLSNTRSFSLSPGTYTVSEINIPRGWRFTSVTCTDPDGGTSTADTTATIDLDASQEVACTYENTKAATLMVTKHVVNDNGGTAVASDFRITVTGNRPGPASFPGNEVGTEVTIDAGPFSVTESGPGSYAASPSAECSGTISVGEIRNCAIVNDDLRPRLTVIKHVVNDHGGTAVASDFIITVTGNSPSPVSFRGNEVGTTVMLNAGSYSVSETGPSGYASSPSAACTDTIGVGEAKTCVITNDDRAAKLIVIKHVVNDNGGTAAAWDFMITVTPSGPGPSIFAGDESGTEVMVNAGSYRVSESGPSGYASSVSLGCTDTIAVGETKTCTITNNDIQPRLVVIKHVVNDNGGTAVASDFPIRVTGARPSPASFLGTELPGTEVAIDGGSYSVSETGGPSGYVPAFSVGCSGTISVGETKTCTIRNDDPSGKLIIVKHVVNNNGGSAVASDFTITVTGNHPSPASSRGNEGGADVTVAAGSYSVTESGPGGYAASPSADCSGTISVGETRTCAITNDDIQPKLIVIKHVVNDDGGAAVASDFTITVSGNFPSPAFFAGEEFGTTVMLNAGTYNVSEGSVFGYSGSPSTNCSGTILVGETKTCTVTNDDIEPTLIVIKHVENDDGGTAEAADFTVTVTGNGPSRSTFAGEESPGTIVRLSAGTFSVTEFSLFGYLQTSADGCSGTIAMGETKTCTFTNDDIQPRLVVITHVVNDNGGTKAATDFIITLTGNSPSPGSFAGHEAPGTIVRLKAGSYSVTEGSVFKYAPTFSADCYGTISVGEEKTCTVTSDDIQLRPTFGNLVANDNGGPFIVTALALFVSTLFVAVSTRSSPFSGSAPRSYSRSRNVRSAPRTGPGR